MTKITWREECLGRGREHLMFSLIDRGRVCFNILDKVGTAFIPPPVVGLGLIVHDLKERGMGR